MFAWRIRSIFQRIGLLPSPKLHEYTLEELARLGDPGEIPEWQKRTLRPTAFAGKNDLLDPPPTIPMNNPPAQT